MRNCKYIISALGVLSSSFAFSQEREARLNVILILTDDQGYGDMGYTGNPYIKTPELDKLHAESICFDNFHTGTTSAPTRSGLMTGHHGNATGVWHTVGGRSLLSLEEYTLAEAFSDSGYKTMMVGKWHLGDNFPYRPFDRGFDEALWLKGGGIGQTPDYWGNNYFDDTYFRNETPEKQEGYCTDIFFDETVRFVTENRDKPFFCYLALNAPHDPYNVAERYTDMYRGDKNVGAPNFYGMITNIDENIGMLRDKLKELGLDKNTVIIYFGDNGTTGGVRFDKDGNVTKGYNGGLRGTKSQVYEGGHRQSLLFHLPEVREGEVVDKLATYTDIMPTLIGLCELKPASDTEFDGIDMLGELRDDRVFVVDTQRKADLVKDRVSCVIKGDWRLINGCELYNLKSDRAQRNNIANEHRGLVAELQKEYDRWWERSSVRKDEVQYIPLSSKKGEIIEINCHDMHDEENKPNPWNQKLLRTSLKPAVTGYWTVEVEKKGSYSFDIYRWSPESGLAFNAAAPVGRATPSGVPYLVGEVVDDVVKAEIMLGDELIASAEEIDLNRESIRFDKIKIPTGEHNLKIRLTNKEGESYSPWFIRIIKK